eukprot:TRINITY_DN9197_c0_g1_i4.p3 TRINITY_DN9197_c0_g1~~TRINITY_DN9197_c0_g1_i4.p3  ORF type:complete len:124 (+),score=32.48 TRINITY_DN9197_c0_g1_i4:265-636(+)
MVVPYPSLEKLENKLLVDREKFKIFTEPEKLPKTGVVFITFQRVSYCKEFLQKYQDTGIDCEGSKIRVSIPPKPEEIRWENIGFSTCSKVKDQSLIWLYCSGIILADFAINVFISFGVRSCSL